jgi:hypothetical protein
MGTPGAVHPRGHRGTDRQPWGQQGPHPLDAHPRGGLDWPRSHRRRGHRRWGPHPHTILREADLVDPQAQLRRQGSELAITNGRTAARLNGGRPSPAKRRHGKWCSSTGEPRQRKCAQQEGNRWSGEEKSMEQSSPVSSIVLRRAIPKDESLTTASRGERGMHGVEAVLGAGCSGWRWAEVVGMANSDEGKRGVVAEASCNRTDQLYEIK